MAKKSTKYIFVTGGVLSGLGKGITAASIGNLLKARGLKVNIQKCDPYLNVDAGLLNPAEHGECFVTKDGAETDLDLGHYERFLDQELTQSSSVMSGRILSRVIEGERNGKYGGKTVQFIPHVTWASQEAITEAAKGFDVHIVEIGGTIGDYEGLSFVEAIRELGLRLGPDNCVFVHVVYLPYLGASQEFKTKPAQNAVRELRGLGIVPDVLVVRSESKPPRGVVSKLSLFAGIDSGAVVLLPNAKSIYQVPLTLEDSGIAKVICTKIGLKTKRPALKAWREVAKRAVKTNSKDISIGILAKYLDNQDTYISVSEALHAAAWWQDLNLNINWIDTENLDSTNIKQIISSCDGIVVPGGFGVRGLEGKILAARFALKHKVPYLGLCLGLQMAVIAAARNAGLESATSEEIDAD
ncbi:MAG: CTP synthase, partial [Patescibacteria group bacterium]